MLTNVDVSITSTYRSSMKRHVNNDFLRLAVYVNVNATLLLTQPVKRQINANINVNRVKPWFF